MLVQMLLLLERSSMNMTKEVLEKKLMNKYYSLLCGEKKKDRRGNKKQRVIIITRYQRCIRYNLNKNKWRDIQLEWCDLNNKSYCCPQSYDNDEFEFIWT